MNSTARRPRFSTEKWCNVCDQTLSVDCFYSRKDRPGEFLSTCKPCRADQQKAEYEASRPAPVQLAFPATEKLCSKCKRLLPLDSFGHRADQPGKRKAHCKDCHNAEKKDYKARNREAVRESNQRYYRENTEQITERQRAIRAAKPEQYRAMHSRWKSNNKEAVNASTHRRRARLKSAGSWTKDDWQRLKATYDWRCLGCGLQEVTDGITLCFDHIIPLSMGGFNIIQNSQCLCRSCNSRKHAKVLDLRDRSYPFKKGL